MSGRILTKPEETIPQEEKKGTEILEIEITLSLLNNKLNYVIGELDKLNALLQKEAE